ncbi:ParA family protein [Salinicoccus sp. YB14-2]|uniref:ParA family protein n=1 Tax=Salinicoccus sp. YB14-2 TaxID=1572701 RepID=UPI0006912D26|nr:AAA family ATPase [Salinicoccus sp. YB14-2]
MRRSPRDMVSREISEDILSDLYETAIVIKNGVDERQYDSMLVSSIDNREATIEAAVHIGYLLTQFKKKVLLVNLDPENIYTIDEYLDPDKEADLISQLKHSSYISESISRSQYENFDSVGVEKITEDDFATTVNQYDLKSKLQPLTNYYDLMIVVGPEADKFNYYANILELVDSALTVVNNKTNDRRLLKKHMDKFRVFNIRSFGIIRKDN